MRDYLSSSNRRSGLSCAKCKRSILDCLCIDFSDNRECLSRETSVKITNPEVRESYRSFVSSLKDTLERVRQDMNASSKRRKNRLKR